MLRGYEFDAAEVSLASYIIAKTRGASFSGIPVFPRRLFSQNHIFVKADSGISHPSELAGKRVIIWAFQVTMSVLAKGDMQRDYGLDWRSVEWLTMNKEEIDIPDLPIRLLPAGTDPIKMLLAGEADAYINPHPSEAAMSNAYGVRRLFKDPIVECELHFQRHGYFPIMHVIAVRDTTIAKVPGLPSDLMRLWEDAKAITNDFYHDPGYGLPALLRNAYERQKEQMAKDIWPSGVKANETNLKVFIEDMLDQGLLREPIAVEQLFHPSVLAT
jgi:4,5-dihydroxyphthalate decarboxylase